MLTTERLILDRAKEPDWAAMLKNVWSRPECARYMLWKAIEAPEGVSVNGVNIAFDDGKRNGLAN